MALDKCLTTCTRGYGMTEFRCPGHSLCPGSPFVPSRTSGNHWSFYCLPTSAFYWMSCRWNQVLCGFSDLFLSLSNSILSCLFKILTWGYLYRLERERERERARARASEREWGSTSANIHLWEKHWLVASLACPNQGSNLLPQYVPWPGIEPAPFWCTARWPIQPSHLARAFTSFYSLISLNNVP